MLRRTMFAVSSLIAGGRAVIRDAQSPPWRTDEVIA
jgi:hypothetical protein